MGDMSWCLLHFVLVQPTMQMKQIDKMLNTEVRKECVWSHIV